MVVVIFVWPLADLAITLQLLHILLGESSDLVSIHIPCEDAWLLDQSVPVEALRISFRPL